MNKDQARKILLDSFNKENGYYYHTSDRNYSNFIDGMAWVSLLAGASRLANDIELAEKCEKYVDTILRVGPDARNFAPEQVSEKWLKSSSINGMWFLQKPQSFAGPAALRFAIDSGSPLNTPYSVKSKARMFVVIGGLFGKMLKWPIVGEWLRQHINSVWLAHLVLGEVPAKGLHWTAEDNPFCTYIMKEKMNVQSPPDRLYTKGETEDRKEVVPMAKRKPSTWIWRSWPMGEYVFKGEGDPTVQNFTYTPTAYLVAEYLQSTLQE